MISFDDLDDFDALPPAKPVASVGTFSFVCAKCQGSGRFVGYSGRDIGACNLCKGTGRLDKPITRQDIQKRKEAFQKGRETKARNLGEKIAAFQEENAAEYQWMLKRAERFEFAGKMLTALNEWGSLTDNQLAAVRRCVQQDAARAEQWAAERVQKAQAAGAVNLAGIAKAFEVARSKGAKKATLRAEGLLLSLAKQTSANVGWVYAKRGDTYLGKISPEGAWRPVRDATPADEAKLQTISADPLKAALKYAEVTSNCSCCGAELTDPVSIARGIGPVCAAKFGW